MSESKEATLHPGDSPFFMLKTLYIECDNQHDIFHLVEIKDGVAIHIVESAIAQDLNNGAPLLDDTYGQGYCGEGTFSAPISAARIPPEMFLFLNSIGVKKSSFGKREFEALNPCVFDGANALLRERSNTHTL
jgi:hypothetical protein